MQSVTVKRRDLNLSILCQHLLLCLRRCVRHCFTYLQNDADIMNSQEFFFKNSLQFSLLSSGVIQHQKKPQLLHRQTQCCWQHRPGKKCMLQKQRLNERNAKYISGLFERPKGAQSCFGHVQFFVTPWTVAHQASLFVAFSRQEYWSGLLCPTPGDPPDPGIEPHLSLLLL